MGPEASGYAIELGSFTYAKAVEHAGFGAQGNDGGILRWHRDVRGA
jgi:hypothetical protein